MDDKQLATLPPDAYILTGDKTEGYGGGPSPYGFVMRGKQVLGIVSLKDKAGRDRLDVRQGWLRI